MSAERKELDSFAPLLSLDLKCVKSFRINFQ
jgi:hypothetical protein